MYNDYELLYLAQENNEDAVNELRKKYNSLLYAKALSYSRSSHIDIKELLNETEKEDNLSKCRCTRIR